MKLTNLSHEIFVKQVRRRANSTGKSYQRKTSEEFDSRL